MVRLQVKPDDQWSVGVQCKLTLKDYEAHGKALPMETLRLTECFEVDDEGIAVVAYKIDSGIMRFGQRHKQSVLDNIRQSSYIQAFVDKITANQGENLEEKQQAFKNQLTLEIVGRLKGKFEYLFRLDMPGFKYGYFVVDGSGQEVTLKKKSNSNK